MSEELKSEEVVKPKRRQRAPAGFRKKKSDRRGLIIGLLGTSVAISIADLVVLVKAVLGQ